MSECPNCERYKLSASMWRNEAYKHAGTPLPWEPEELLRKEYERGFIDGMQKQMQSSVDKAVNAMTQPTYYIPNKHEHTWVGLTDDEIDKAWRSCDYTVPWEQHRIDIARAIEYKLKEKNT